MCMCVLVDRGDSSVFVSLRGDVDGATDGERLKLGLWLARGLCVWPPRRRNGGVIGGASMRSSRAVFKCVNLV